MIRRDDGNMGEAIAFFGIIGIILFIGALINVIWFRWLVIIGVSIFVFIKWIYPKIHSKIIEHKIKEAA